MSEKHSHADFQGGRSHSVERRHHGNLSPELHTGLPPTRRQLRGDVPAHRVAQIHEIDAERSKAIEDYKKVLDNIPDALLTGHQLERKGVCGDCRGKLYHPMDGHYHSASDVPALCCKCCAKRKPGWSCPETWSQMKGMREKISSIADGIEERIYHWVCTACDHRWRNKKSTPRPCRECGSKKVKGIKVKKAS